MPDREYGGGSYNSGYGTGGSSAGASVRGGDTPGFGTGGGGSVGGGGGYGAVGGLLAGGGGGGRDAAINATERANRAAGAARAQAAAQQAFIASQPATGPATRGGPAVVAAQIAARNALINNFVRNTAIAESGGVATAKNPLSSATGLHQFTQGTWNKMIETYRPDLLEGRTKQEVLALRTDPNLSTEMATNLARENADYLESRGLPVNEGSLYLSHFLGSNAAANVLKASPDTPISNLVGEKAIKANQDVLGGDRTAADVAQWASNRMYASAPARGAVAASGTEPLPGPLDAYQPDTGFAPPSGGEPVTKPAQQAGLLDMLFGGPAALQKRITDLEAAGRTSTYPTFGDNNPEADWTAQDAKQWYADQFAGGDVSKVKSRISDFGQGPVVDYYVKDIPDVIGEAVGGLFGGIGNLFKGGEKPVRGPNEAYGAPVATGSIFGNLFSGTPRADYGPYGNLTLDEYNRQYGGGGGSQRQASAAVAPASATPSSAALAQIPTPEELARNPYLWQQYYNRIPQNYGIQMAQAPLVGPAIRGIFS